MVSLPAGFRALKFGSTQNGNWAWSMDDSVPRLGKKMEYAETRASSFYGTAARIKDESVIHIRRVIKDESVIHIRRVRKENTLEVLKWYILPGQKVRRTYIVGSALY